jgi:hypothetical protein
VTVPDPAPAVVTVNALPDAASKVAVTFALALKVTVHAPVPLQLPPQSPKE